MVFVWVVCLLVNTHHKHWGCSTSVHAIYEVLNANCDPVAAAADWTRDLPSADGAEMTTFLAPPFKWAEACSRDPQ